MNRHTTITCILMAATLLLLLSGGGILPWSVWVGTLLLLLPAAYDRLRPTKSARITQSPAALPFLLVLAYLLVMLIPVPLYVSLLGGLPRFQENEAVHDMIQSIREAGLLDPAPASPWFAMTRNHAGTLRMLLYALLGFAGYEAASRARPRARTILWSLALLFAITAIAGTLGRWVWPQGDTLWWYMRIAHGLPGPMAGFVNPNHYAGFLALGVAVTCALLADALHHHRPRPALAAIALLVIIGTGVLLSLSRGGLLASGAAIATVTVASLRRASRRARLGLLLPPLLLALGIALTAGLNPTVRSRLAELRAPTQSASGQDRLAAWADSLRIFTRYPIFGAGPNAYRCTYPMHRTHSDEQAYRTFAENEYIQLLCDTGLLGLILAIVVLRLLLRPLRARGTPPTPEQHAMRLAAYAALAAAAVHASVEFVLHLPLYQLILLTLLALATPEPTTTAPPHHRALAWALPLAAVVLLSLTHASFSRATRRDRLGFISAMDAHELTRALPRAPTEAHLWTRLGQRLPTTPPKALALRLACLEQAIDYDPLSASLHVKLARARLDAGDEKGAAEAVQQARRIRPWVHVPPDLSP